jgi:TolB protein
MMNIAMGNVSVLVLGFIVVITMDLIKDGTPSIGEFDNSIDMGNVYAGGAAMFDAASQTYTIRSTGNGTSDVSDEYHFLWKSIQGDFILRAEVDLHATNGVEAASFGWAVRNTISDDSAMISAMVDEEGSALIKIRDQRGGSLRVIESRNDMPDVIHLERINGVFKMKTARFGEAFVESDPVHVPLRNEIKAGLFVSSGEVTFRNVRIVKPFPEHEQRYQRYLGSRMEVLDVHTGHRKVLFESEHSVQAPNWTVDGKKLIYNSNGYLYNYELETGQITYLNTGFATNNNNDHVISFDGELLAISHHVPEDNNQSTIFILPVEGSDYPKQVTASGKGHAFLHGISPDNQTVIFTGWRNGKYDIYAADVNTMEETQLTDTPFLDDGSEYSPDGEFIWFNSNRTGTMEIWRMRPDGSEQTRITFDENFHDWFPHISPDGKWVLFLSYGLDVDSGDHPFYKQVTLRMMPAEGGEPEIVAYLYGGQGTINVPSWSPDSRYVAFVSNSGRFY